MARGDSTPWGATWLIIGSGGRDDTELPRVRIICRKEGEGVVIGGVFAAKRILVLDSGEFVAALPLVERATGTFEGTSWTAGFI
jgi:hypothetical protein